MGTRRPTTPPNPAVDPAAVDADHNAAMAAKRDAKTVDAGADEIIRATTTTPPTVPPPPAQVKANEAKNRATDVENFANAADAAWEAFFLNPGGPSAGTNAGQVKINAGKATTALEEAKNLLEEAKKLHGVVTLKTADELRGEIDTFVTEAKAANDTVVETAGRIRTVNQTTPSAGTKAALTAVTGLVTRTATLYGNVLDAQTAAKVAPGLTEVQAAHGSAKTAKDEAEENARKAALQEANANAAAWVNTGSDPKLPKSRDEALTFAKKWKSWLLGGLFWGLAVTALLISFVLIWVGDFEKPWSQGLWVVWILLLVGVLGFHWLPKFAKAAYVILPALLLAAVIVFNTDPPGSGNDDAPTATATSSAKPVGDRPSQAELDAERTATAEASQTEAAKP